MMIQAVLGNPHHPEYGVATIPFPINDQGGQVMEISENMTGTLRAQEHGHQPLVYENHGLCGESHKP